MLLVRAPPGTLPLTVKGFGMASNFIRSIVLRALGVNPRELNEIKETVANLNRGMTDEGWAKYSVALSIAINAGVLNECQEHQGSYFPGDEDIEKACTLGKTQFTAGKLKGTFQSTQELTDIIKFVVHDNAGSRLQGRCSVCASYGRYGIGGA